MKKYRITEPETSAPGRWVFAKTWLEAAMLYGRKYLGDKETELEIKTPDNKTYTAFADGIGMTGFR